MRLVGIALALIGWAVAVSGLFVTTSHTVQIVIACVGIGITLFGILGVLNGYYLERAIWKK